jgi:GTP cyclohydrolase IV
VILIGGYIRWKIIMNIKSAQSAQRVIDQIVDRLANGETELLLKNSSGDAPEDLLASAVIASALTAREAGEPTNDWTKRQKRRLPSKYHALVAKAVEVARSQDATQLEGIITLLVAAGITGLSTIVDDLSTDPWTDVPSLDPIHRATATWSGICNTQTRPKLRAVQPELLSCTVDIRLLLPKDQRGAHMSRMQTTLLQADSQEYDDLDVYALEIISMVSSGQPNVGARIGIEAEVRFGTQTRKTGLASFVRGSVGLMIELDSAQVTSRVTRRLSADIATACPCTMRYSRLATARDMGLSTVDMAPPTFTHSQPGKVNLEIVEHHHLPSVSFADMFRAAGTGAHLREAVLKRPDEHDLVERIHRRPQFAEDVVRAVAMELAACAEADADILVSADLDESIHPHRAHAMCSGLASDFWRSAT